MDHERGILAGITHTLSQPNIEATRFNSLALDVIASQCGTHNVRTVCSSGELLAATCLKASRFEIVSEFAFTGCTLSS